MIGTLESRIVLNASAEITSLLGLNIVGDAADDIVRVDLVDAGNALQLTDGGGNVIPIAGHSSGPSGSETDPLAITDIPTASIRVDLGGGDDQFDLELPDGINVDLIETAGDDTTTIKSNPSRNPSPDTTVRIESESIRLASDGSLIPLADRNVTLVGDELPIGNVPIDLTGDFPSE